VHFKTGGTNDLGEDSRPFWLISRPLQTDAAGHPSCELKVTFLFLASVQGWPSYARGAERRH